MVFYDKYNDFLVFESPHIDILVTLCFAILDHNRSIDTNDD